MNIAVEIPDEIGALLNERSGDLSRSVLEAIAVEAYRSGTISSAQVQQMLALPSRFATESFLRRARAWHDYSVDDLQSDLETLRDVSRR